LMAPTSIPCQKNRIHLKLICSGGSLRFRIVVILTQIF
jgi:hypothetical protein